MKKISRREAFNSLAATAIVGLGATASEKNDEPVPITNKKSGQKVKPMTLQEFQQMNGPIGAEDLFRQIDGHTFAKCHKVMREKHGIWIPELVPVFEKLDAMQASGSC